MKLEKREEFRDPTPGRVKMDAPHGSISCGRGPSPALPWLPSPRTPALPTALHRGEGSGTCSTAPGPLLRGGWGGCYVEVGSWLFPAPEHLLRAGLCRDCICGHVPAAAGGVRVQSPDLSPEVRVSFCLSAAPRPQMWGTAPSLHPRSSRLPSPSTLGWRRGLSGLQDACAPVARAWLPGGLHLLRLGVGFFRGLTSTKGPSRPPRDITLHPGGLAGWGGDPVPGQNEWKQPTEARCSVQPHHKRGRTRARQRCVCRAVSSLGASALQRASLAGQSPRARENRKAMSSRRQQESWGPAASTADGGGWAGDRTGT